MTRNVERAAKWMYRGVWGILTGWLRVPQHPPTLPVLPGEELQSFRLSEGYLRYLKLQFWLRLAALDGLLLLGWVSVTGVRPQVGIVLAPIFLFIAVVPQVFWFLGIHLQYDTTWYVLSTRSLRIRTGIWTISEATITFENIQNVTVESGPIERCFRIGNVIVDTAGGRVSGGEHGKSQGNLHRGEIAGVSNAAEIRQLILSRLSQSKVAGLGDETHPTAPTGWTSEHIAALREIRDALQPRSS